MVLVLLLSFTIIDVEGDIIIRFIVGSVMLLAGLSIFLWGVDLAMNPIGENMAREIATSISPLKIALLSFFLGFLITVAEPDLLVLGSQIESASGGTMSSMLIVYMVSIGVGVLILLGVFRLLRDKPLNVFMTITSVSYTHLDVYKRQSIYTLNEKKSRSPTPTFESYPTLPYRVLTFPG